MLEKIKGFFAACVAKIKDIFSKTSVGEIVTAFIATIGIAYVAAPVIQYVAAMITVGAIYVAFYGSIVLMVLGIYTGSLGLVKWVEATA